MKQQYKYLYIVSTLMILSGAALGMVEHLAFHLIYLLGGAGYLLYYLIAPEEHLPLRERRLIQMNAFAGLLFVVSGVARLGVFDAWGAKLWILFLLLAVIFMIYANLVLANIRSKNK